MGTCNEIANSPEMVARVSKLYWATEKGSTAVSVLLPWLPSKARRSKDKATIELFMIVKGIIDERRRTGRQEMDTLQVLLDEGDNVKDIGQVKSPLRCLRSIP
jgi:sterol 14-demethylase